MISKETCEYFFSTCVALSEKNSIFSFSEFASLLAVMVLAWTVSYSLDGRILTKTVDYKKIILVVIFSVGFLTLYTDFLVANGSHWPSLENGFSIHEWRVTLAFINLTSFLYWIFATYYVRAHPVKFFLKSYSNEMCSVLTKDSTSIEFAAACEKIEREIFDLSEAYENKHSSPETKLWAEQVIIRLSEESVNSRIFRTRFSCWMSIFKSCFRLNHGNKEIEVRSGMYPLASRCLAVALKSNTIEFVSFSSFSEKDVENISDGFGFHQRLMLRDEFFMYCLSNHFLSISQIEPQDGSRYSTFGILQCIITFSSARRNDHQKDLIHYFLACLEIGKYMDLNRGDPTENSILLIHYLALSKKLVVGRTDLSEYFMERCLHGIAESLHAVIRHITKSENVRWKQLSDYDVESVRFTIDTKEIPETLKGVIGNVLFDYSKKSLDYLHFPLMYFLILRWIERGYLDEKSKSILSSFDTIVFFDYVKIKEAFGLEWREIEENLGVVERLKSRKLIFLRTLLGRAEIQLSAEKVKVKRIIQS